VTGIGELDLKVQNSLDRIAAEAGNGRRVIAIWPRANEQDVGPARYEQLASLAEIMQIDGVNEALETLGLKLPAYTRAAEMWMGSPFRGLEAFSEEHRDIFCGRGKAIEETASQLHRAAMQDCAFLLIEGSSGAGKSSLARAGLVPFIKRQPLRERVWRTATVLPGDERGSVIAALAAAVARALPESIPDSETFAADIRANAGGAIAGIVDRIHGQPQRLIVVADQLEQLLALPSDGATDERALFVEILSRLASSGVAQVIATMRSDSSVADDIPALNILASPERRYRLQRPSPGALREIVLLPAQRAGVELVPDKDGTTLADAIVLDAAGARDSLPLLEFVLENLYEKEGKDTGKIRHETYLAAGRLEGAIGRHAEAAIAALGADAEITRAVDAVILALGRFDEEAGKAFARTLVLTPEFETPARARVIKALVEARLLILDKKDRQRTLRVAHEAVLSNWPRAVELFPRQANAIALRDHLDQEARIWSSKDKDKSVLVPSGRQLRAANDLLEDGMVSLSPLAMAYVGASNTKVKRRQNLIGGIKLIVLGLVLFVPLALAFLLAEDKNQNSVNAYQTGLAVLETANEKVDAGDALSGLLTALENTADRFTYKGYCDHYWGPPPADRKEPDPRLKAHCDIVMNDLLKPMLGFVRAEMPLFGAEPCFLYSPLADLEDDWGGKPEQKPEKKKVKRPSCSADIRSWNPHYPNLQVVAALDNNIAIARRGVPRCLQLGERSFSAPPAWCIELGKWPYETPAWKTWLIAGGKGPYPPQSNAAGPPVKLVYANPDVDDGNSSSWGITGQIERHPDDARLYAERCASYRSDGSRRAMSDCDKAIAINPNYARAYDLRGRLFSDAHDYTQAIANFDRAIKIDPKNTYFHRGRGNARLAAGEKDAGIADLTHATEIDPSADQYRERGRAYFGLGAYDLAIADQTTAITIDPQDAAAYNERAKSYREKGLLDRAVADHKAAIRINPESYDAYNDLGETFERAGGDSSSAPEFNEAIAEFTKAIEINPEYGQSYINRARLEEKLGRFEDAIRDNEKALEVYPTNKDAARSALDRLYEPKRQDREAFAQNDVGETYERFANTYARDSDQAIVAFAKPNFEHAIAAFTRAIEIRPGNAEYYFNRARVEESLGRFAEAIGDYKKVLDISPSRSDAKLALERLYESSTHDPTMAK
jgi:tetratricopeptide (TPR) repeat protein